MDQKETEEKETKLRFGVVNFERRRHPRFSLDLPIEYYQVKSSGSRTGRAVNASEGGLLVYLSEKIELGQLLTLKLFVAPDLDLRTVEMVTQVVWVDMHLERGSGNFRGEYRCGLKIVDISPEDMNSLKGLLQNLAK
jgi:hypothetical protein